MNIKLSKIESDACCLSLITKIKSSIIVNFLHKGNPGNISLQGGNS